MQNYLDLLQHVMAVGVKKEDRTGVGTLSVLGAHLRFNLERGFPLLTTKKLRVKDIIAELLWFLSGDTNISALHANGVTIWDEWADEKGDLGRIYGAQWRSWRGPDGEEIDQITRVVNSLQTDPNSRRHIVVAYNPGEVDEMALPPCHAMFQFYVANERLSCSMYQRSSDLFLGVPYNIASYSLLTMMVAQQCDLIPGDFVWFSGDTHIYLNHLDQVKLQLSRSPLPLPSMVIARKRSIFDYDLGDFVLEGYEPYAPIKAPIAV